MCKYPIGIDIDDQHIYAVQLKKNKGDVLVRGAADLLLNSEGVDAPYSEAAIASALKKIAGRGVFYGKSVVLKPPSGDMISFPIQFELESDESVEEAVLRIVQPLLTYPIEEAIIDFPSVHDNKGAYKATVITMRRDQMRKYLKAMNHAGLNAEAIDVGVSSLIRLHSHIYGPIRESIVICHIGLIHTLVSVVTSNSILACRSIQWGVNGLIEKVATNLELKNKKDQAQALIMEYGLSHEPEKPAADKENYSEQGSARENIARAVYQVTAPYIEEIIFELHKMIGYIRSEERLSAFQGIYLYGHAFLIKSFDKYLQKRVDIPTQLVDPFSNMIVSDEYFIDEKTSGQFAISLGLALREVPWL
ncbi:MAG: pilus assembly protein PilM [Pseudomonadota bacterium]